MDGLSVAEGASAAGGVEELTGAWKIDYAKKTLTPQPPGGGEEPNADGTLVYAASVVAGAVDGVDDPGVLVLSVAYVVLLAEEAAAREQLGKVLHEKLLHGNVAGGDDVCYVTLLAYYEIVRQHQRGCLTDDIYYLIN